MEPLLKLGELAGTPCLFVNPMVIYRGDDGQCARRLGGFVIDEK